MKRTVLPIVPNSTVLPPICEECWTYSHGVEDLYSFVEPTFVNLLLLPIVALGLFGLTSIVGLSRL